MKIIHISGTPGSGKTTIGGKISAEYFPGQFVKVVDTDQFISHETEGGQELLELEKTTDDRNVYNARWKAILQEQIALHLKRAERTLTDVLVLTGILNNFSFEDEYYMENADLKLFITIPNEKLLSRYYNRLCSIGDKDFWKRVAEGVHHVDGSEQVLKNASVDLKQHQQHGYIAVSQEEAFRMAISFIKDNRR